MPRFAASLLAGLMMISGIVSSGLAQETATPAAGATFDLAMMTLAPSDLLALGEADYGLANQSSLRDAETDALVQADGDIVTAAQRNAVYVAEGFQSRYVSSMLRPREPLERYPSGLVAAASRISTSITEFSSADGAAAVFAYNEGPMDDAPGEDIDGTQTFGDESELTRSTGTEVESGEPLQRLELSFRTGPFIAEVTIVDYQNVEPEVATVEQLAGLMLAKIERVQQHADPGLSARALRLDPAAPWIESARLRDFYVRHDHQVEPTFAQIVDAKQAGIPLQLEAVGATGGLQLPIDTYMYWTPVGEGDAFDLPLYVTWLDRYASAGQAAVAIDQVTADLGPGYVDVQEVTDGAVIGEESRQFTYTYEDDPAGPVSGVLIIARSGDTIIRTQVDSVDGVQGSGVERLAAAQVDCLNAPAACAPLSSFDVLTDLVIVPDAP